MIRALCLVGMALCCRKKEKKKKRGKKSEKKDPEVEE